MRTKELSKILRSLKPDVLRVVTNEGEEMEITINKEKWTKWADAADSALSYDWAHIAAISEEGKILWSRNYNQGEGEHPGHPVINLQNLADLSPHVQTAQAVIEGQRLIADEIRQTIEPLTTGLKELCSTLSQNFRTVTKYRTEDLDMLREAALSTESERASKWEELGAKALGTALPGLVKQFPGLGNLLSMFGEGGGGGGAAPAADGGNGKAGNPMASMLKTMGVDLESMGKMAAEFFKEQAKKENTED